MSIGVGRSVLKALLPQELNPSQVTPLECDDHLIKQLIENGLGPIAHSAVKTKKLKVSESSASALLSADLTARVISNSRREELDDLLRSFAHRDIKTVLLKGIAVAPCYPHYHWRVMSDIDLLVSSDRIEESMSVLRNLGYVNAYPEPDAHWNDHHHVAPLRHPITGLCVELHHSLDSSAWFDVEELGAGNIWKNIQPVNTFSVPTNRLEPILELNYLASHWYLHLIENPGTYGLQRALFDAAYILQRKGKAIDKSICLPEKCLSFATLTLLFVLSRLDAIDLPETVIKEIISDQRFDRCALESNSKTILKLICSVEKSPTTLWLMIQSSWIELALINDNPSLFEWRRLKRTARLLGAAGKLHSRQLLSPPASSL